MENNNGRVEHGSALITLPERKHGPPGLHSDRKPSWARCLRKAPNGEEIRSSFARFDTATHCEKLSGTGSPIFAHACCWFWPMIPLLRSMAPLAPLVRADRPQEIALAEGRPIDIDEAEFGVRHLPQ